jgi:hypothetical protein
MTLTAALAGGREWMAGLFVAGGSTVFVGFLLHMAKLILGNPRPDSPPPPAFECRWKLGAMMMVAAGVIALGFWLPKPLYALVLQSAQIVGGTL